MKEQFQKRIDEYCEKYKNICKEQKLKITFNIKNGIALNRGEVFFDAILASALLQKVLQNDFILLGDEIFDLELPLKKLENDGIEYYAASLVKLKGKTITERLRRKFDEQYLIYCESKKIDIQRGEFKSLNKPYLVYLIDELVFYAIGNKKEVEELLSIVDCIGGKRKLGYGRVLDVKVEEVKDCKVYRRIPNKTKGIPGRVNPPYFLNSGWVLYEEGEIECI
jgi:hypothetical protein